MDAPFSPARLAGTAALAMVASASAALENIPVAHFAAAVTALTVVHKAGKILWAAWRGAEAWLDERIKNAVQAGSRELRDRLDALPCVNTGGAICDDTGELRRVGKRRTPVPRSED